LTVLSYTRLAGARYACAMPPDQRKTKGARDEFEVAWYTKELGRSLQRQLLQQRLDGLTEARLAQAAHGEEPPEAPEPPPPDQRAG
jgi:hypothetical protein